MSRTPISRLSRNHSSTPNALLPCKYFGTAHGCRNGAACMYKHISPANPTGATEGTSATPGTSRSMAKRKRTTVCYYYGTPSGCYRGDACLFKHDSSSAPSSQPEQPISSSQMTPRQEPPSSSIRTVSPSTPLPSNVCAICYEEPKTYGLLPTCSHVFCISCIKSWRGKRDLDLIASGVIEACPVCRTAMQFIIPSEAWYGEDTAEDKKKKSDFVERWKAGVATVPCVYYQRRLFELSCPFGLQCPYKHEQPRMYNPIPPLARNFEEARRQESRTRESVQSLVSPRAQSTVDNQLGEFQTTTEDFSAQGVPGSFATFGNFAYQEMGSDRNRDPYNPTIHAGWRQNDEEAPEVAIIWIIMTFFFFTNFIAVIKILARVFILVSVVSFLFSNFPSRLSFKSVIFISASYYLFASDVSLISICCFILLLSID